MKSVAIVALSNPIKGSIDDLAEYYEKQDVAVYVSKYLYTRVDGAIKAAELKDYYDQNVDYILDVSGGDLALDSLYYIDFRSIKESDTIYIGYSDLTTIINAIYQITNKTSYLYQPRYFLEQTPNLDSFTIRYVRGSDLEGVVIGGNIRCFLKLAGTTYFPNVIDKVLFLESYHGDRYLIESYFAQLRLLGVFDKIRGLLLGSFTELEETDSIIPIALKYYDGPIIKTDEIGHQKNSKSLKIGGFYQF